MRKRSFADINCPIAQTLELVGEWWTLLIIRNAFCGMRRFDDFQRHLDISSNILSARLQSLVASGILLRQPAPDDGRAVEYTLTNKGRALYPVLLALTQWGETWAPHPDGARGGCRRAAALCVPELPGLRRALVQQPGAAARRGARRLDAKHPPGG